MIPLKVTTVDDEHPDLTRREMTRMTRAGHLAVGLKWSIDLLPQHFKPGARYQFGYAPRTAAWLRKKQRLFNRGLCVGGPQDDLVFNGRLREEVLRSARNNIRAFPSRVTVTLKGPEYFTLRPRIGRTAQLAREVITDSRKHEEILGSTFDSGFEEELRNLRRARRLRKVSTTR